MFLDFGVAPTSRLNKGWLPSGTDCRAFKSLFQGFSTWVQYFSKQTRLNSKLRTVPNCQMCCACQWSSEVKTSCAINANRLGTLLNLCPELGAWRTVLTEYYLRVEGSVLQCVAMCCNGCALCCHMWRCFAMCCNVLHCL